MRLKKTQNDLNTDVKLISTKLKKMVKTVDTGKLYPGNAAQFEKSLDEGIEENFKLKEEFLTLQKRVALLLKKNDNDENSYGSQKNIQPAFSLSDKMSRSTSAKGPRTKSENLGASGFTVQQEEQLEQLKQSLFKNNQQMQRLQYQIDDFKNQSMQKQNSRVLVENKNQLDFQLHEANR